MFVDLDDARMQNCCSGLVDAALNGDSWQQLTQLETSFH